MSLHSSMVMLLMSNFKKRNIINCGIILVFIGLNWWKAKWHECPCHISKNICRNPSLGLTIKVKACEDVSQKWSPKVTFHVSGSVRECERMNPHTPKWAPILGVGLPMDSQVFRKQLQGSKTIGLKISLYHWKALETYMFNMGSHDPFGYLKHKLWPKEGSAIKLPIWLPTTKIQESPWFPCVQVDCHIPLISFQWGLQLCLTPHLHQRSAHKVMRLQSHGNLNFGNFRTPTWESQDKMTFGCWPHCQKQRIL